MNPKPIRPMLWPIVLDPKSGNGSLEYLNECLGVINGPKVSFIKV